MFGAEKEEDSVPRILVGLTLVVAEDADRQGIVTAANDGIRVAVEDLATGHVQEVSLAAEAGGPPSASSFLEPGDYRFRVADAEWWSPGRVVSVGADAGPVHLALPVRPAGTLRGELERDLDHESGRAVEARFRFASKVEREEERETAWSGTALCRFENMTVSCDVPAGVLDLRLELAGHAPLYRWGLTVPRGGVADLGRLELTAGASVTAIVLDRWTLAPVEGAEVELRAAGWTADPEEANRRRSALRTLTGVTDSSGFFQIRGVPPGAREVWVAKEGYAAGPRASVEVVEEREYRLADPLLIGPPASVRLLMTPPLDPHGEPWRVQLLRHVRGVEHRRVEGVPPATTPSGTWSDRLEPGSYVVKVGSELDPAWHTSRLQVEAEPVTLDISVDAVAVDGYLSLDGEPVAGVLWFGGRHGAERIRFAVDPEGKFRGYVPREGEWEVDLARSGWQGVHSLVPVQVERTAGQGVAQVDIELPDTVLRGKVVDAEGGSQPRARLLAVDLEEGGRVLMELADDEGEFEFRGLPESTLALRAQSSEGSSAWVPVRLDEDSESSDIVLRIDETHPVRGKVTSATGPVADATLKLIPRSSGSLPVAVTEVITRVDGTFEAAVPGWTRHLDVLVLAPGHTSKMLVHRHSEEGDAAAPPGALTIVLQEQGGVLGLQLGEDAEEGLHGVLEHDGARIGTAHFARWQRLRGAASEAVGRLKVPRIAPGWYRLCGRAPSGRESGRPEVACVEGYLPAEGELHLSLEHAMGETE